MILIPIKRQQNAKQRLASALDAGERVALARAMLEDVLDAVVASPSRPPVTLVTSDAHARALAQRHGFGLIDDADEAGETAAIEMATRIAVERGAAWTLVIPGDAPLVTPAEIEAILQAAPEAGSVLVPDAKQRGSNAVLRRPADLFPLRFGNDSFAPHLRAARATGKPCVVLRLEGIALDVDDPADLAALAETRGPTRSQRLLAEWRVSARLRTPVARSS